MYWFLDADDTVLYVGKAKHLKNRLSSYRLTSHLLEKTVKLIQETRHTRVLTTVNEVEALITEARLIHAYQPQYNAQLKDDKSALYIVITDETFPRVFAMRKSQETGSAILHRYGPFPSAAQTRRIMKLSRRLFPFCSSSKRSGNRACLYYHLNLCPGACCGQINQEAYAHQINHLHLFLSGKIRTLVLQLTKLIKRSSRLQQFETAAEFKRQLETVEYFLTAQIDTTYQPTLPNLTQDMVKHRLTNLLTLLKTRYSLPGNYRLHRIEAYDISNLGHQDATASMVVYTDGLPDKTAYRHFKMRHSGMSDYAMMKEVLTRRANHPEWPIPQLIVIDGGRGQVRLARRIIPWNIPVVSIAKRPDRLILFSELVVNPFRIVALTPDLPATALLLGLRDESHRFARRYHHHLSRRRYNPSQ